MPFLAALNGGWYLEYKLFSDCPLSSLSFVQPNHAWRESKQGIVGMSRLHLHQSSVYWDNANLVASVQQPALCASVLRLAVETRENREGSRTVCMQIGADCHSTQGIRSTGTFFLKVIEPLGRFLQYQGYAMQEQVTVIKGLDFILLLPLTSQMTWANLYLLGRPFYQVHELVCHFLTYKMDLAQFL